MAFRKDEHGNKEMMSGMQRVEVTEATGVVSVPLVLVVHSSWKTPSLHGVSQETTNQTRKAYGTKNDLTFTWFGWEASVEYNVVFALRLSYEVLRSVSIVLLPYER